MGEGLSRLEEIRTLACCGCGLLFGSLSGAVSVRCLTVACFQSSVAQLFFGTCVQNWRLDARNTGCSASNW